MNGIDRIAAERQRQTEKEGWTPEHDDQWDEGQLVHAATCYLLNQSRLEGNALRLVQTLFEYLWPWAGKWWKPNTKDPIRDLEKAGALIAAEIDRMTGVILPASYAHVEPKPDDVGTHLIAEDPTSGAILARQLQTERDAAEAQGYRKALEYAEEAALREADYTEDAIKNATAKQIMENLVSVTQSKTAYVIAAAIRAKMPYTTGDER